MYIPYGRQNIDSGDIKEVIKVLRSDWLTQGPTIQKFEKALSEYTGARYAVVVSSGTAALHLACLALGINSNDEVITSPITFLASANCILYCNAKPIFADIEESTVNIDPLEIEKKVASKTKAIIPVDFAGHPADLEKIYGIAKKHKLFIIEDACHALGGEYKDVRVGSCKYSDVTIFSFHPVKHITTGEGGAITTNNRKIYEMLLALRNHGIIREKKKLRKYDGPWYYEQHWLGFNYRITDLQSALGISQLEKINRFVEKRKKIANIYKKELADIKDIILPSEKIEVRSSWHIFYLRIKNVLKRNEVFEQLKAKGIGAQIHYIPVHLHPYYRDNLGYREGDYPRAEAYYKATITIPLYPKMKSSEIYYVIKALKAIFK